MEYIKPDHVIRRASGAGETHFDSNGHLQQTGRYLVRIWCDCGWTCLEDVESISETWTRHSNKKELNLNGN